MALVYLQCWTRTSLRPGGVMAVVVKDYVKSRQRVLLVDETLAMLVRLGFRPIERARAWVVERRRELHLHGPVEVVTSRKSFFRRLAEKKGAPAIDYEEVLFVRR